MKIIILGAGLIGVCSAYYLKKLGYDVTVVDRQKSVSMETSFANGGQISVCYSEPWSNFSNVKKMISWIGKEDSPLLIKPKFNLEQTSWFIKFLNECIPKNNHQNIIDMLKISLHSRTLLKNLRTELNINYEENTNGILTFYTSEKSYNDGVESSKFMSKFGCDRFIKNKNETLSLEPILNNSLLEIFGSDYTPDDESGNAKIFTDKLYEVCKKLGVKFLFETEILELNLLNDKLKNITITPSSNVHHYDIKNHNLFKNLNKNLNKVLDGDVFINCLGSYSVNLLKKININYPIYPAKGYSLTIPIIDESLVNKISLTDNDFKIVLTKLNDKLRIAGTAEFNGYNLEINKERCLGILNRVKKIIPSGLDFDNVEFWTGLRPATPGMVPIIEQTKIKNLFINSGHGTLGWTMAVGSGDIISKKILEAKF